MTKKEREERLKQVEADIQNAYLNIVDSEEEYKKFLNTSSYMTKYEFEDQLMIYVQRPEASACASFKTWKEVFGKVVKKDTKGIPIIRYDKNGNKTVNYVFDIKDTVDMNDIDKDKNTVLKSKQKKYHLWEYNAEDDKKELNSILSKLGITPTNNDSSDIIINKIVSVLISKNFENITKTFDKLNYPDVDTNEMVSLIDNTINYLVYKRLNIENTQYLNLSKVSTLKDISTVKFLVSTSNTIARGILNELQKLIEEKSKINEKTLEKNINSSYTLSEEKKSLKNENIAIENNKNIVGGNYDGKSNIRRNRILFRWRNLSGSSNGRKIYTKIWNAAPGVDERRRFRRYSKSIQGNDRQRIDTGLERSGDGTLSEITSKISTKNGYTTVYRDRIDREYTKRPDRNTDTGRQIDRGNDTYTGEESRNNERTVGYEPIRMDTENEQRERYDKRDDNTSNRRKASSIKEIDEKQIIFDNTVYTVKNIENIGGLLYISLEDENNTKTSIIDVEENFLREIEIIEKEVDSPTSFFNENLAEQLNFNIENNQETSTIIENRENFKINYDILPDRLQPRERLENNINAIKTLLLLEKENRNASKTEQETLSKYVGWGGLAEVFEEKKEGQWKVARDFLKENLTEEEYKSAVESTLTAFYTPKVVIDNIYSALSNIGFKGGNILEPSMGIGNFIGNLPDEMSSSNIYGVELDSISGKIAKYLYPNANIQITGYEKTNFENDSFDLVIGNVPFGDFKLTDRNYDKNNFLIHDYFFAKSIDKVRTGGLIAFITSSGTMDKQDDSIRRYIGQRCDFLGAIRLPNNTFKGVAGTEVTSDIIFLQKREKERQIHSGLHNFLNVKQDKNGLFYNQYFIDNPKQVIGIMKEVSGRFGNTITCVADESSPFDEQLKNAINNIKGEYKNTDKKIEINQENLNDYKPFSYHIINNEIYYKEQNNLQKIKLSQNDENKLKELLNIKDVARDILDSQLQDISNYELTKKQQNLNLIYDNYVKKYGYIRIPNKSEKSIEKFRKIIEKDSSYPLLLSIEQWNGDKYIGKSDIFNKRTIAKKSIPEKVNNSMDALTLSISEKAKVDFDYMISLTDFSKEKIIEDLKGEIYLDVVHYTNTNEEKYLTKDEYLSGNVREKAKNLNEYIQKNQNDTNEIIQIAKENIVEMEKVIPEDIKAEDIRVCLGSTWIPTRYYNDFMYEFFKTPFYLKEDIKINYFKHSSTFNISNKSRDKNNDTLNLKYGTNRVLAYELLEDTLNLKDTNVYDRVIDEKGNKVSVLNEKETLLARQKQEILNELFKEWIFKDPKRRQNLTEIYNNEFNSIKLREYDGSNINFVGMNIEKTLQPYQKNAVAHTLFGGNTLLAHCVGAGKTYEMIASAMESKRLGLCNKSLFVVPGHLTEQTGAEFLTLYPNANILVANERDFEKKNRKLFTSKIATGNYDAIIIGDTQFEKVPMSKEYKKKYIQNQIDEIVYALEDANDKFTVKELEKTRKKLKEKYEKLHNDEEKDDVVTFEELGVDKLYIDEAHEYKNLSFITKMTNIAGINPRGADKSSDLFMKCRYIDEKTNSKGIVFATGTPISNSMTELYTMQKYLQYEELKNKGHHLFDSWASQYGEKTTTLELAPEGTGFRQRTRFSKYVNLPELLTNFKQVADIQTSDMLNLPVPNAIYENITVSPSQYQKDILEGFVKRAEIIRGGRVDPRDDNMLKLTTEGRKLALDQRLINPLLPKDENSKSVVCANKVYEIYKNTEDKKSTQVIFCDTSTPGENKEFNIYDDIKEDLISKGIKKEEIAYIHDAKTKEEKQILFNKVKKGEVRVLFGSTKKMGTGTNVQDKLIALHDLDAPYRPSDLEQRSGRIVRQGNENEDIYIYRYITEQSFDAYMYQLLESKQRIISQVMSSKSIHQRELDDDELALSYAEIKALATGNPLIKEKLDLDMDIKKLNLLKSQYNKNIYDLQDKIYKIYPAQIKELENKIDNLEKDLQILNYEKSSSSEFSGMYIKDKFYQDKKQAGEELLKTVKSLNFTEYNKKIGKYMGFDFSVDYDNFDNNFKITLKANHSYSFILGNDIFGNFTRLDNKLNDIQNILNGYKTRLDETKNQLNMAKEDVKRPFQKEDLLKEKVSKLKEIERKLSLDEKAKNIEQKLNNEVEL